MSSETPMNRRRFFRHGLAELLKPLDRTVRPLESLAHQLGKMQDPPPPRPVAPPPVVRPAQNLVAHGSIEDGDDDQDECFIRPPGARPEIEFTSICSRCSNCVHACPVSAIQLDHSGAKGAGAPYIDPEASACVMCEGLACMNQCPSSALQIVPREQIDIGLAVWHESTCIRHTAGDQCSMCVDHCPVGPLAIRVDDNSIVVDGNHCTGCGSCQNNCPTQPRSIRVVPKSRRDVPAVGGAGI